MKTLLKHIILLLLAICMACDEKIVIINCAECTENDPVTASVTVKLDPEGFPGSVVRVFEGPIEENIVLSTHYPNGETLTISLKLNRRYSISAIYTDQAGNRYEVVDGLYPRVKYEPDQCEYPCYFVYGNSVNLKLKYKARF